MPKTRPNRAASESGQGAYLAAFIVLVAAGVAYASTGWSEQAADRQAAESRYLQAHQCVVAEMRGKYPFSYRCDSPPPSQYVSAVELARKASAH